MNCCLRAAVKSCQGGGFASAPCHTKSWEYALDQRAAFSLRKVAANGTLLATRTGRSSQYCSIWNIQASKDSPFFPEKGGGWSGFKWTKWGGAGSGAAGAAGAAVTGRALRC